MRLDNDASKRPHSPAQSYANGSSRSPASRSNLPRQPNRDSHIAESNGSHTNGSSIVNAKLFSPTFFGHDRVEVTRILIQSLIDLGYNDAAGALVKESGYSLEGPTVAAFRNAVLNGDWAEAEELLFGSSMYDSGGGIDLANSGGYPASWDKTRSAQAFHSGGLPLAEGADRDEMLFQVKEQKYLEILENRDLGKALMVLRHELTPLHHDTARLRNLSR